MVKRNTRRGYKKRRTVRKLKRTQRRNTRTRTQKGGLSAVVSLFVPVLMVMVGGDKVVDFLKVLQSLAGGGEDEQQQQQQAGGRNKKTQHAGGRVKENIINNLTKLRTSYAAEPEQTEDTNKVIDCIDQLINKVNSSEVTIPQATPAEAAAVEAANPIDNLESDLVNTTQDSLLTQLRSAPDTKEFLKGKVTEKVTTLKGKLTKYMDTLSSKIQAKTGFQEEDMACIRTVKDKILSDITSKFQARYDRAVNTPAVSMMLNGFGAAKEALSSGIGAAKGAFSSGFGPARSFFGNVAAAAPPPDTAATAPVVPSDVPESVLPQMDVSAAPAPATGMFGELTSLLKRR